MIQARPIATNCRWSRHVPGHQATGLLALPGALLSPAHPSDTLCCGVRNIPLPSGPNAVNFNHPSNMRTQDLSLPSVLVPHTGRILDPCTLSTFSFSRISW